MSDEMTLRVKLIPLSQAEKDFKGKVAVGQYVAYLQPKEEAKALEGGSNLKAIPLGQHSRRMAERCCADAQIALNSIDFSDVDFKFVTENCIIQVCKITRDK